MNRTKIAQDYLDCCCGDHGDWWKNRADQFIEDNLDSPANFWDLWALIRRTEQPTQPGS